MTEVINLKSPIKVCGVETNKLEMREPTVADTLAAKKSTKSNEDMELVLFANLLGIAPNDLHALTLRDYALVQKAFAKLTEGVEDFLQPSEA